MNSCNCRNIVSVKLPKFEPDPRLAFVDRICSLMIEDRFGPAAEAGPLNSRFGWDDVQPTDNRTLDFTLRLPLSSPSRNIRQAIKRRGRATTDLRHSNTDGQPASDVYRIAKDVQPRGSPLMAV